MLMSFKFALFSGDVSTKSKLGALLARKVNL